MAKMPRALIVVTSHDHIGDTGRKTGFYYDEMATPYWSLTDAGLSVDIASIQGGPAPHDPGSIGSEGTRPAAVARFLGDSEAVKKIDGTQKISEIDPLAYRAIFLPGGHGTMWDFAQSEALGHVISAAYNDGAIVGAVCHGPAGLLAARHADRRPLVESLRVNSFTDAEEEAVGLTKIVPYLLESRLRELGAKFEAASAFKPKAVRDGRLVTGQNPQSVSVVADALLEALSETRA